MYHQYHSGEVPFSFKQGGGTRKDLTGRELHGRTYDEMPRAVRELAGVGAG
jgi:protein gp37